MAIIVTAAVVSMALAKGPSVPGRKSNTANLYLFEKDPTTWEIVDGGAWGKMKYNLAGSTFDFIFNAHGLEPNAVTMR